MSNELALRKARGAFFTPPEMSRFIAAWALRRPTDVVLEPSCGEAGFLLAAAEQLSLLGALPGSGQLRGIELHQESAEAARSILCQHNVPAEVTVSDFFDLSPRPIYDAVIGNPPYVRYQQFSGAARAKGLRAALAQGVRLTGLASSWAAFTIHAAQWLKPSGRLGLVLPGELLTVKYAAEVRRFLLGRFASVRLVMFEELVFPGVLEEVVLLLAEGTGPAPSFEVFQARDLAELGNHDSFQWTWYTPGRGDKWTGALLPSGALEQYRAITSAGSFTHMLEWGETYLGAVTGNNSFFTLGRAEAARLGIPKSELLPISPPGSRHLRGLSLTRTAWEALANEDAGCYLFNPGVDRPSLAAQAYIRHGEKTGVNSAYKCRTRRPWWRVPVVPTPDILLTYMDHDRPRLITNSAGVCHLNSIYGISLKKDRRRLGCDLLPIGSLNSVTLLGAEMVGRAYGGGLLKLEPTEADLLPVPSLVLLEKAQKDLRPLRSHLSSALRRGKLGEAADLVDSVLLTKHLGLSGKSLRVLREAREVLFSRRITRGRGVRGVD